MSHSHGQFWRELGLTHLRPARKSMGNARSCKPATSNCAFTLTYREHFLHLVNDLAKFMIFIFDTVRSKMSRAYTSRSIFHLQNLFILLFTEAQMIIYWGFLFTASFSSLSLGRGPKSINIIVLSTISILFRFLGEDQRN